MAAKRRSNVRTGTGTLFGRAAIYARISLDKAGEAAGVGRQIDACRHLADLEGWSVDEVLADNDLSAYSGACRPEYERLLDLVRRREIDVIVAYHPDRVYRRLADLVELTKAVASAGVEIRTVAAGHVDLNTASGRFTAQVLGAAAEHESARIGERVSAKHHQNAERGNAHGGGRSYGYRRVAQGRIEVVQEEADVIREAAARVLAGQSLASIVVDFNERGIPSANGKKWRPGSLAMVLRSGRITAPRESKGVVVGEANWEPILDRAAWEQVRSRLNHAPIGRRPKVNLLAGMCRCAECGAVMAAVSERMDKKLKPGQRPPRRTIACDKANRHGCGSNTVKADYVEQIVVDYVLAALEHTDIATARARRAGHQDAVPRCARSHPRSPATRKATARPADHRRHPRRQGLRGRDNRQLRSPPSGPATSPRRSVRRARSHPERQAGSQLRPQPSPTGAGRERRPMRQRTAPAAQPSPPSTAHRGGARTAR